MGRVVLAVLTSDDPQAFLSLSYWAALHFKYNNALRADHDKVGLPKWSSAGIQESQRMDGRRVRKINLLKELENISFGSRNR